MDHGFYMCDLCGRAFGTPNGLRVHKLSKVHEKKAFLCNFCNRVFRTPAYLFMHLERGVCGEFTQLSILKSMKAWEADTGRHRWFTFKRSGNRILSYSQDHDHDQISQYLTATRYSRNWAVHSFDGVHYRCHLCNRPFKNQLGLEQHLSSIAHEEAHCYACKICDVDFRLLSSLFQHLESESCPWRSYKEVKDLAYSLLRHLSGSL